MPHQNDSSVRLPETSLPRVVVVGGGFGGNAVVEGLAGSDCQVVLIDRNNFHQFQPLLYQVASCGLEADSIIFPLRKKVQGMGNVRFRMAEVEQVNPDAKELITDQGAIPYDRLVLATGSASNFFGNEEIEKNSIGLKDIREALDIRSRILHNLERATATTDEEEREALTNIVIVGGGPAGVEMAGALAEFRSHILEKDYPDLIIDLFKIWLVQSGDRLLKGMSYHAAERSLKDLGDLGVEVCLHNRVQGYDGKTVVTDGGLEIPARTMVWTAGVRGDLPSGIDSESVVRGNRVAVNSFLKVKGYEDIYAVGDIACLSCEEFPSGHPMVAQPAIQQGVQLAKNLASEFDAPIGAKPEPEPFEYFDKGSMATIGKNRAVADVGDFKFGGFIAWVLWSLIHVVFLTGIRNKVFTLCNWAMSYISYEKGHRYIVRRPEE